MPDPIDERPSDRARAEALDAVDPLADFRREFELPQTDGRDEIYLVGNSLGLLSHAARAAVVGELDRWGSLGVRGHFAEPGSWWKRHETIGRLMAPIVGAKPDEITVMNGLTVNLHLLLVSFYEPTPQRHKILIDEHAFPSDHFAVESQIRQRGFDPSTSLVTVGPRPGRRLIDDDDLVAAIDRHGDELAVVLWPGVQYYTGQCFDLPAIVAAGHRVGSRVGFDLAHAVGNVELALHDSGADFAAWCTYKYLNGGPGSVAGAFVAERHLSDTGLPRLQGWWGTDPETRFQMGTDFEAAPNADAWQLSCGAILSQATLEPQLELIARAGGMPALRAKAVLLVEFLDRLLDERFPGRIRQINPRPIHQRGCQFALEVIGDGEASDRPASGRDVFERLEAAGVACDWREPNVIRVAPVPLYTRFVDLVDFAEILEQALDGSRGPAGAGD